MVKLKIILASLIFDFQINPKKINEIFEKNSQFLESGIFVKEDDQDWGSSGMNDIQSDAE